MLAKKLFLKPGFRFIIINAPKDFRNALGEMHEESRKEKRLSGKFDFILLFVKMKKDLEREWPRVTEVLNDTGILWVAYPKKSSGITSDLASMSGSWEVYESSVWQPVSSASIDETWTAIRFKNAPTLGKERIQRTTENIYDLDRTLCVDKANRIITPAKDFQKLLDKNPKSNTFFNTLSFTNKKEYVLWIIESKKAETRDQRLKMAIEKLTQGKKNPSEK